jgi:class 3 adenylate cyclase
VYLDLRGFTAFSETSAPEEVMHTLGKFHAVIGGIVHEHDATLERFTGDGMMVVVGDPLAVEQPALDAVRLAIAIRDAAKELAGAWSAREIDLGLSVGVALGYATVGAIGFEGRIDYGAIGTVTNQASRLCQEAQAGEILISQRVRTEMDGLIDADDLGDMMFHGFSRPMRVYRCNGLLVNSGVTP